MVDLFASTAGWRAGWHCTRVGGATLEITNWDNMWYPLVKKTFIVENDGKWPSRNSGFTHEKWCFCPVRKMSTFTRPGNCFSHFTYSFMTRSSPEADDIRWPQRVPIEDSTRYNQISDFWFRSPKVAEKHHINIYTVKNKVRMRFWLRVMVARLAPPHGSRILTEETPVNMQKHS